MLLTPTEMKSDSDSQDILSELRTFVAGASRSSDVDHNNLVKTAISLLKTLPAARESILEYFGSVFHSYVIRYLSLLEDGTLMMSAANDNDILLDHEIPLIQIQNVLCNFVRKNSEAWAPIVSTWSLELLGDISSRYGSHNQLNSALGKSGQVGSALNKRLQFWTVCGATRALLDINTQCMSCLMHSNTEACINALLDMSVLHSPHFDWVVVHVGSSFPETVINKVLTVGIKDFCSNEQAVEKKDKRCLNSLLLRKNPKLISVVAILGHLASSHFIEIRNALLNLFKWSLEETVNDKSTAMQKTATVPYLLHLASLSQFLLKALSVDTLQTLNMKVLMRLSALASDWWCYFKNGRQGLLDLVVRLLLNLENSIYHVLTMLLDTASLSEPELLSVSLTAQEIIELLINKMDLKLRTSDVTPPLVRSFYTQAPSLKRLLLSKSPLKSIYATKLFIALGKYNSQLLSSCIAYLLNKATTDIQIERLVELTRSLHDHKFFCFAFALSLQYDSIENVVPSESPNLRLTLWKNVQTLLKYENRVGGPAKPVIHGLSENFGEILNNLKEYHSDVTLSPIIASVIQNILAEIPRRLTVQETLALTEGVVLFFFSCVVCELDDTNQLKACQLAINLLTSCSLSCNVARNQATRLLIEIAINPPVSPVFGGVIKPDPNSLYLAELSLLKENIKQGNNLMVAQSAMSVFHAGIIGNGFREVLIKSNLSSSKIKRNTQYLMEALRACCLADQKNVQLEAVTNVALLLVQLISPDVMFNGLPWPEEDFCKVTVERDLCIRKSFDNVPLLWTLMKFVAVHRPSLCYCSVLLRAITASLISQWNSASQGRSFKQNVQLLDTTILLLDVMSLGQLLPPPLSGIRDIVPHLSAPHVLMIFRECIWNYMRDHVPTPTMFARNGNGSAWRDPATSKPTKQYTETLRIIMLNNIDKLGDLYNQLFAVSSAEND